MKKLNAWFEGVQYLEWLRGEQLGQKSETRVENWKKWDFKEANTVLFPLPLLWDTGRWMGSLSTFVLKCTFNIWGWNLWKREWMVKLVPISHHHSPIEFSHRKFSIPSPTLPIGYTESQVHLTEQKLQTHSRPEMIHQVMCKFSWIYRERDINWYRRFDYWSPLSGEKHRQTCDG